MQRVREQHGREAARHHEVALREVHRPGCIQDQHEAEGHQRVGGAEGQDLDQQLRRGHAVAGVLLGRRPGSRSA